MLTQQQWVEGCYAYYAENGYEPGNPEDGVWEEAHYPVPKCEGGEATIKLLKEHHAVQGVLQSEEYQRPCIWGWEANYLEGEMLELCKKWVSEQGRRSMRKINENLTPAQRSEKASRARAAQLNSTTPEQRSEIARKARSTQKASSTPEQRSEWARRSHASRSPEERSETQRRLAAARSPEWRSEMVRRAWETRRRKAAESNEM